jgi:hypothetical protein
LYDDGPGSPYFLEDFAWCRRIANLNSKTSTPAPAVLKPF